MNRYVSNIRSEEVLLTSLWWLLFDWIWFIFPIIYSFFVRSKSSLVARSTLSCLSTSSRACFFSSDASFDMSDGTLCQTVIYFEQKSRLIVFRPARQTSWCCRPEFCICFWSAICAALVVGTIVTLAHIPLHHQRDNTIVQQRDSGRNLLRKKAMIFLCFLAPYLLIYAVNLTNMTDLTIIDRISLANRVDNSFFFW